jgi:uncharacterized protein Usg
MNTHDLVHQLMGWRQTTAEILHRMPDRIHFNTCGSGNSH